MDIIRDIEAVMIIGTSKDESMKNIEIAESIAPGNNIKLSCIGERRPKVKKLSPI
jgi:hypothetical protein